MTRTLQINGIHGKIARMSPAPLCRAGGFAAEHALCESLIIAQHECAIYPQLRSCLGRVARTRGRGPANSAGMCSPHFGGTGTPDGQVWSWRVCGGPVPHQILMPHTAPPHHERSSMVRKPCFCPSSGGIWLEALKLEVAPRPVPRKMRLGPGREARPGSAT